MMATGLWLIVWLIDYTPDVHEWNGWAVWLAVALVLDLLASAGRAS